MEAFFKTHKYLVEHLYSPVRRGLMDEIDWNDRLIGIKGSRGVGKTTFLLDYAREHFGADNKECLYINLNHFYFTERTLVDFASEFRAKGGKVLLIDQVFKYSGWSKELRYCYDNFTDLKIIFSGSSVMRLKDENPDLSGKVVSYNLRGFSFRLIRLEKYWWAIRRLRKASARWENRWHTFRTICIMVSTRSSWRSAISRRIC